MLHLKKMFVAVFVVLLSLTSCEKETIKEVIPTAQEISIGENTFAKGDKEGVQVKVVIVFDVFYDGTGEALDNAVLMLTKEQNIFQGITDGDGIAKIDMENGTYSLQVVNSGVPVNIVGVERGVNEEFIVRVK